MMQRKRIVSLAMIFSLLAGLALPVGAAEAVVFIHSEEDWEQFVEQCVQDVWSQGLTVHLTADTVANFTVTEYTQISYPTTGADETPEATVPGTEE